MHGKTLNSKHQKIFKIIMLGHDFFYVMWHVGIFIYNFSFLSLYETGETLNTVEFPKFGETAGIRMA